MHSLSYTQWQYNTYTHMQHITQLIDSTHTHTHTASPGPLPVTPTGPGGSVFNFCSPPLVSPGKPFRPASTGIGAKGMKPILTNASGLENTAGMQNIGMVNYPSGTMFAGR